MASTKVYFLQAWYGINALAHCMASPKAYGINEGVFPAGLVWNQCACALYGIAEGVWHQRRCISCRLGMESMRLRIVWHRHRRMEPPKAYGITKGVFPVYQITFRCVIKKFILDKFISI